MKRVSLALCLGAAHAGLLWQDVCTQPDTKGLPFCDMSLPHPARVDDYVGRVPLAAKAAMMVNEAAAFEPLHIPPYQWGSEGLHGPLQPCVCTADNRTCRCPTSFPCPSALGAAFNDSLYFLIGRADGREARAINNLRDHATQNEYGDGIDYWSPTINMQRDPRWGRNQEVPGEDPTLTASYATQFVRGLQGLDPAGLDADHVQITACCKHFVANSLESWNNATRHNFDAVVSQADLQNYYLPAFRGCVMEGGAQGVMCSYNAINGVPACANDWLLQTTLREGWRFEGYVTSDCGAIRDECLPEPDGHGYLDCVNATAASITAGTDVDCGGVYGDNVVAAVGGGALAEEAVDAAFARLATIQMRLGLFDDKAAQPYFALGIDDIDTEEHRQLAREAALQSIVLLKNEGGVLPLAPGGKLAVVGPHAVRRTPAGGGERGGGARRASNLTTQSSHPARRTGPKSSSPTTMARAASTATARGRATAPTSRACRRRSRRSRARTRAARRRARSAARSTATSTTSPPRSPSPPLPTRSC